LCRLRLPACADVTNFWKKLDDRYVRQKVLRTRFDAWGFLAEEGDGWLLEENEAAALEDSGAGEEIALATTLADVSLAAAAVTEEISIAVPLHQKTKHHPSANGVAPSNRYPAAVGENWQPASAADTIDDVLELSLISVAKPPEDGMQGRSGNASADEEVILSVPVQPFTTTRRRMQQREEALATTTVKKAKERGSPEVKKGVEGAKTHKYQNAIMALVLLLAVTAVLELFHMAFSSGEETLEAVLRLESDLAMLEADAPVIATITDSLDAESSWISGFLSPSTPPAPVERTWEDVVYSWTIGMPFTIVKWLIFGWPSSAPEETSAATADIPDIAFADVSDETNSATRATSGWFSFAGIASEAEGVSDATALPLEETEAVIVGEALVDDVITEPRATGTGDASKDASPAAAPDPAASAENATHGKKKRDEKKTEDPPSLVDKAASLANKAKTLLSPQIAKAATFLRRVAPFTKKFISAPDASTVSINPAQHPASGAADLGDSADVAQAPTEEVVPTWAACHGCSFSRLGHLSSAGWAPDGPSPPAVPQASALAPGNVVFDVDAGVLRLLLDEQGGESTDAATALAGAGITSGLLPSYGCFEVRLQSPPQDGLATTISLVSLQQRKELADDGLDQFERSDVAFDVYGRLRQSIFISAIADATPLDVSEVVDVSDTARMVNYGVRLGDSSVEWYLDGKLAHAADVDNSAAFGDNIRMQLSLWAVDDTLSELFGEYA